MLRAALPGQGSWPGSFCSRTAPLELRAGFSRPPAHQHPLGQVGRREREGARESYEREREKEPEEEEEGFGQEGRGEFSCRAGMCGISCSASSRGPCPSSCVSCSACTAGLLSELSVQRESRFYAAFVSLRCQHSPRWMQVV